MTPTKIHLHKGTQILDIHFGNEVFKLTAEFLRVHSPSAEVQGHGGEGGELPTHKKEVKIIRLEPAGNYAVRIHFDDGHNSGIYTWNYLYKLGKGKDALWQIYLQKLHESKQTRTQGTQVLHFSPPKD